MEHLYQLSTKLPVPEMKAYINQLIEKFKNDSELIEKYPFLMNQANIRFFLDYL